MLKLAQTNQPTNQPTNRPTDQQTNQQTGQTQYIKLLTKFGKNILPPDGNVFQLTFFVQDIIGTILVTKFHEDQTINLASSVNKEKCTASWCPYTIWTNLLTNVNKRKNAPPPGGHVFQSTQTIFKLVKDIIRMNLLTKKNAPPPDIIGTNFQTKFHDDQKINVASRVLTGKNDPLPSGHVFQTTGIIF
ncbi:hypothetical protein DPMN_024904 [Dreissena polymorpha]|uniref:Uncharacterized protein n=1 Tax=Dreissena polymorpha TaxID=45954 RepID=A0A9D4LNA5_DREPO|nr:hypothetical protein DPMN_024904 [Dreissena polymorpha]